MNIAAILTMKAFSSVALCLTALATASWSFQTPTRVLSFRAGPIQAQKQWLARPLLPHRDNRLQSTFLGALSSSSSSQVSSSASSKFDYEALFKYFAAIGIQVGLFALLFRGLDTAIGHFSIKVPTAVNFVLFYGLALKSRVLNPLANDRPNKMSLETKDQPKRKMPSFTPPGFVFPIVWLLIIGPIRAATSCMIYNKLGYYASIPLLALMLHLSIGDVWNTINNVERRYGASVVGVLCVWLSKAHAAYQFYQVDPLAGKLLGATLIWLTIASTLIAATWTLNPDENGNLSPLYPATGVTKTKFAWFAGPSHE